MILLLLTIFGLVLVTYWVHLSPYSQLYGRFPYRGNTDEKVVALTFDDGPNEPFTSQLLDTLKKYEVPATFFLVGKNVQKYPETAKRIAREGHTIGNHSLNHQFWRYFAQPSFKNEIVRTQDIITQTTGRTPRLFRPPWLQRNPALFGTLKQLGIVPVSGEFCHPLEVFQVVAEHIAHSTLAKIRPGSIIIFHDGHDAKGGNRRQTIKAVKLVIEALKKQGYAFTTVDKLLKVTAYK